MATTAGSQPSRERTSYPVIVIGTRAQLVKMAPILRELEKRNADFRLVFTGQHLFTMEDLLELFAVRSEPVWIGTKRESDSLPRILRWFLSSLWSVTVSHQAVFRPPAGKRAIVVTHGDTMSTLLGAFAGKFFRSRVAHVESGLTSSSWREPFPEELTRRLIFRLTDIAFCPGPWSCSNMKRYGCEIVNTKANSLLDTLRFALSQEPEEQVLSPAGSYCVVSMHRFENLHSRKRLRQLIDLIIEISGEYRVEFVLHPATKTRLSAHGLLSKLLTIDSISLRNRLGYVAFVGLLSNAAFVITDGGSNQEELSYLAIPTLIIRNRTERQEGIGSNAELLEPSNANLWKDKLRTISGRGLSRPAINQKRSPSRIIVDRLLAE